jgi:antiviral defense system Shedu protein SduA
MNKYNPTVSDVLDLGELRSLGIELDQKLLAAFRNAADDMTFDSQVFHALNRQNVISTRILQIDSRLSKLQGQINSTYLCPAESAYRDSDVFPVAIHLKEVLNRAIRTRRVEHTLGTRDFLEALVTLSIEHEDSFGLRPRTADLLSVIFGGTQVESLKNVPEAAEFLRRLKGGYGEEDNQFIVGLEADRLVFRTVSVIDDFVQATDSGLLVPQRALLTHFQQQFGAIDETQILALEDLLNSKSSTEDDFQRFFEKNPHFFRRWDYREVHPHVLLVRDGDGPLIPDFVLTDRELQQAMILELKRPSPRLITRQRNRDRFAAAIQEARAQLLTYREWFRERRNRDTLRERIGMSIYEPRLAVIIGRSSEFLDEFDRQRLTASHSEIEVVTYDDILRSAKRRRLFIEGEQEGV